MNAIELAATGSWVATHSGSLIFGQQKQPMLVATDYWTTSKIRLERWTTALNMFQQDMEQFKSTSLDKASTDAAISEFQEVNDFRKSWDSKQSDYDPWPALKIVVQEILVSELLTRVWSAAVTTHDWYHQADELQGLAHSIHICHIEARNKAMRILLSGRASNEAAFDRMNGLRRSMERWTDLFLGQLPQGEPASVFGFDRHRVMDFHREQRETVGPQFGVRQKLLSASFATDMRRSGIRYAANPELNREIVAGILACFPNDRFDAHGLPKSIHRLWIEKSQLDTQALVNRLAEFESAADGIQ